MPLFGPVHLTLLATITAIATVLCILVRRGRISAKEVRLTLAYGTAINELIWWGYRYSHEGIHLSSNLPLQLCDASLWVTVVVACATLFPAAVDPVSLGGMGSSGTGCVLLPASAATRSDRRGL